MACPIGDFYARLAHETAEVLARAGAYRAGPYKGRSGTILPGMVDAPKALEHPDYAHDVMKLVRTLFTRRWLNVGKEVSRIETIASVMSGGRSIGLPLAQYFNLTHVEVHKDGRIDGTPQGRCLLVEDVLTSGGSVIRGCEALRAHNYTPAEVLALVTWEQDILVANMKAAGLPFHVLTTAILVQEYAERLSLAT